MINNNNNGLYIKKEEAQNFIASLGYLKDLLVSIDVSEDFAADETDNVTAWDLLTQQTLYKKIASVSEETDRV